MRKDGYATPGSGGLGTRRKRDEKVELKPRKPACSPVSHGRTHLKQRTVGKEWSLRITAQVWLCVDAELEGFVENTVFRGGQDLTLNSATY